MELPILGNYTSGFSKVKLTFYKEGFGLLGFGLSEQIVKGVHDDIFVRSFAIRDSSANKIAVSICDLAFITDLLKVRVLEKLQNAAPEQNWSNSNVILLAQHTHSAPGGFGHYLFYNMSIPGLVTEILEFFAEKITESILIAQSHGIKTELSYAQTLVKPESQIAFNRSLEAYNKNLDVEKIRLGNEQFAVNREMLQLNFEGPNDEKYGAINWFGTHTTNVSNDNHLISADNKGFAAQKLESKYGDRFCAAFTQGSCGDVSPKFNFNPEHTRQRGYFEGMFKDDFESAQYNGFEQAFEAEKLLNSEQRQFIHGEVSSMTLWYDFSQILCSPKYTYLDKEVPNTGPSMGTAFIQGALRDGPGIPKFLFEILNQFILLQKWTQNDSDPANDPKNIVVNSRNKKLSGLNLTNANWLPSFVDPTLKHLSAFIKNKAIERTEWLPSTLPIQAIAIGNLLFIGIPFEITTVAQRRLLKSIKEILPSTNCNEVIVCPYANSYAGYITTPEEYEVQMYEGGHTLFGRYSLAALQTAVEDIINAVFDKSYSKFGSDEMEIKKELLPLLEYPK